ncbi:tape measure protein [Morganella morganii]|uniref:tape measure protein n=1 Tax=Morganella morganii TaxID=582 RepID=UPI001BDB83DF|nr:tape measure protein [Morganella morganii]MBT0442321.1 tape measure protein [Morganella morganii subsp. morganii]
MAQVGEIVYQVQMDVAQLLTSQRQLDQRLRNMEGGFNRTTNAVNGTERSMASLSRVAASLTAYLSVSAVTSYAEAWTVLNNKLSNSVRASESLVEVTERVFNISQDTRSSLDATATLYARLERGTRQYNTSAEDLAKLTTIINQGFIVSGATAQEAENAIIQLSQGIASGVLRGEEFNSVSEQGSRLMVALADSMDVSIGQLRAMAAEGKLTTDVVVNGLLSQGAAIGEEFSKTTQTMSQALQEAGNNITKFFGNSSTVQSFISVFNDSVVMVSENLDYLTNILVIAAGVIGSRYAGALALAGAAQVKKARDTMAGAAASRQAAMAERDAAVVLVRKTVADRDAAMSALNLAQAEYQVARGSAAEATALANVTRLKTAYSNAAIIAAQANNTLSASQARVTATGLTMANALRAVNSLLAPIGGPMGAAMLAGAAVYYFFQKAEEAKRSAHEFADSLNGLRTSMDKLTRTGLSAKIAEAKDQLDTLTQAQKEAEEEVKNLNTAYKAYSDGVWHLGSTQEKLETISRKLAKAEENLERVQNDRSKTINFIGAAQAQLNGELLRGEDLLKREAGTSLPNAAAALRAYGLDLDNATKSKQKFNAESLQIQWSDAGADLKKQLEREIKIANAPNEVEKRKLQVGFYAEDKGLTGAEVERLKDLASSAAMVGEAKKEAQKKSRDADSAGKKSASEALKSANAVADALKNQQAAVDRLNQGYKEGSVELAKYDAAKALGDDATPAQIAQAEKLAAEKFAIEQRSADQKAALDANALAKAKQTRDDDLTQLERQLKAGDVTFEQSQKRRAEINAEYAKKAAEENAKSAVTPVQEMAAQVDPVQALANEHAQKLALIKDYMNQRVITEQQGLALMNAANKEYDEQRTAAQWQLLSQQSLGYDMLTSAVDSLSGNASNAITGLITQTMSWSDAARSLGNTMLNSVVNSIVQVGVEMAKNFILGQTLGVATQAANASAAVAGGAAALAAWTPAAIAASIATMGAASASGLGAYTAAQATGAATSIGMKALAIAGARKDGGPVSAGEMYRVGEGGKPEIFKASNGNQYMIPGDNGKVISNRDIGGGQVPVTVNINDYSSGGNRIDAQARQDSNGMTIDVFIADMDNKGPMHSAITRNTTASARVR